MAGHKNKGMMHGKQPKGAIPFEKGSARTLAIVKMGNAANKAKWERIRSLKEAAKALMGLPSEKWPEMNNALAVVYGSIKAAAEGDSRALNVLAQLMGELVEKIDVQNLPILRDDVPRQPDPQQVIDVKV